MQWAAAGGSRHHGQTLSQDAQKGARWHVDIIRFPCEPRQSSRVWVTDAGCSALAEARCERRNGGAIPQHSPVRAEWARPGGERCRPYRAGPLARRDSQGVALGFPMMAFQASRRGARRRGLRSCEFLSFPSSGLGTRDLRGSASRHAAKQSGRARGWPQACPKAGSGRPTTSAIGGGEDRLKAELRTRLRRTERAVAGLSPPCGGS